MITEEEYLEATSRYLECIKIIKQFQQENRIETVAIQKDTLVTELINHYKIFHPRLGTLLWRNIRYGDELISRSTTFEELVKLFRHGRLLGYRGFGKLCQTNMEEVILKHYNE